MCYAMFCNAVPCQAMPCYAKFEGHCGEMTLNSTEMPTSACFEGEI